MKFKDEEVEEEEDKKKSVWDLLNDSMNKKKAKDKGKLSGTMGE